MKNKLLLTNRDFTVEGDWYAPLNKLTNYKSVIEVDHINQTSSAGDWDGYFIQKIWNKYFLIFFNQANGWPFNCFKLYTGDVIATSNEMFSKEEIYEIYERIES